MRSIALCVFLLTPSALLAQGTQADYDRSAKLRERFAGKVFRDKVEPKWYTDGSFSYEVALPEKKTELVLVEPGKATRTVVKPEDLKDKKPVTPAERKRQPRGQRDGVRSPDGKLVAKIKDHNIVLRKVEDADDATVPLTTDGTAADRYERLDWSPNSKSIAAIKVKQSAGRIVTMVESSPKDQLQPKLKTLDFYLKPGDEIPQPKVHLFDVGTRKTVFVSDELFKNPWDISYEHWSKDSSQFYFVYNQRGHGIMRVLAVDATTGRVSAVVNEECATFFDYSAKLYVQYLDDTDELIWMSERSGWNHLYLVDLKTTRARAITSGNWLVRQVETVDVAKRTIQFQAMGVDPKQDPYHVHHLRCSLGGEPGVKLNDADGTHTPPRHSPDGQYYLTSYSRVDLAPVTELRRTSDGKLVLTLERADTTELTKAGWKAPERFVAKARDTTTDIYGLIYRQTNFDPKKKYPVIEYIYAGPHGFHVPKAFSAYHRSAMAMAELGFIVVQMDGLGTNWRSKAFHDVCWKNLGDSGFPDRINWIRTAAAKYPEMDLSKGVGIFGGSAGGQSSTRAMLAHADFYSVCVSDCGCHDNRMDKIWWNELWMSWPVGPHYAEQSNTNPAMVKNLKGKLMLVVGELDSNVDPASTLQVANALIKADKDFDLLVIPGAGHGACETPYGQRRRADFFVRHLLGVEPRK